jgi:hypothetical protein
MYLFLWLATSLCAQDFTGVERIVAVGDVHGDFEQFVTTLRAAGVVDGRNRWTGGKTHMVQTGDVLDRGPDSRKAMDFLMNLERQAQRAGGRVHALIGNHEAMNIYGDLRYVAPAEYAAFQTSGSAELRRRYYEQHLEQDAKAAAAAREDSAEYLRQWEKMRPLGWFEHRLAFSPEGKYGKWIIGHDAVIKINDAIFLHGGISPKYASVPFNELNKIVQGSLKTLEKLDESGPVIDPEGPLWYRGLAQGNEAELELHLANVLSKHNARMIVIGHTPTQGTVVPRFGGRVLMIDVGLSAAYNSRQACLIIEGGKAYSLNKGKKLAIPTEGGAALREYMRAALQ